MYSVLPRPITLNPAIHRRSRGSFALPSCLSQPSMALDKPTDENSPAHNPPNAGVDGCFEITLARRLARGRENQRLQIQEAISQYGWQLSWMDNSERVELAAALQWEFRRRTCLVKHDEGSLQTLQHQYRQVRDFVMPIYRLPIEILTEVFTTDFENKQSPIRLMLVCRDWCLVVEGMASMWKSLELGTWTPLVRVERFLQRVWWMNVVIHTEEDVERREGEGEGAGEGYIALTLALANASRWKRLTIDSLPQGNPVPSSVVIPPINGLKYIRVASRAQSSSLLDRILENIGTAAVGSLSMIETTSHQTIRHLLQSEYVHLFHFLTTLKADIRTSLDSVDLLPHLLRIEDLDLTNISLPPYAEDVDLPLIHSLHHLRLKAVSIQWMGGRTFPQLESCSIHSPTTYPPLSSDIYFPICHELEFGHRLVEVAGQFLAPKVYSVTMKSNEWTPLRGSKQVILLCRVGLGFQWQPAMLHLSVLCDEGLLLSVLKLLPALSELQLDNARPGVLGRRFFKGLLAKPMDDPKGKIDRDWDEYLPRHVGNWESSICPSLKRLVLKYERWLRQTDRLDMLPPLMGIGWSRSQTATPLESFRLCFKRSETKWEVLDIDSDMLDVAVRDIPQLKPFQRFSSFFRSCVTATITSVLDHGEYTGLGLPDLQHTLPIFESYFCQLSVLRLHTFGQIQSTFDILPNFFRLEELDLYKVDIPSNSINAGLPLFKTLLRLSLDSMTLTWMDGCVFTRLKRLSLDAVSFGEPLSVGLPVCSHIRYVGEDHCPLQSIFRVPTLIEFRHYGDPFSEGNDQLRLLPTRTLFLRSYLYTAPEFLVAGIASLVELEVLNIDIDRLNKINPLNPNMALLTALGRNEVEDEYGEGASTLNRGPRSLICPNLRRLALGVWTDNASEWEEIVRMCKQIVDTRRDAGQALECCRIWRHGHRTPSIVLDTSGDGFEVNW